jgi:hypothetical protein
LRLRRIGQAQARSAGELADYPLIFCCQGRQVRLTRSSRTRMIHYAPRQPTLADHLIGVGAHLGQTNLR